MKRFFCITILFAITSLSLGATNEEMLEFVNNPTLTAVFLNKTVGLAINVSNNIMAAKRPFKTVAELDAVPYVGLVVMSSIKSYIDKTKLPVISPIIKDTVKVKYITDNRGKIVGIINYKWGGQWKKLF